MVKRNKRGGETIVPGENPNVGVVAGIIAKVEGFGSGAEAKLKEKHEALTGIVEAGVNNVKNKAKVYEYNLKNAASALTTPVAPVAPVVVTAVAPVAQGGRHRRSRKSTRRSRKNKNKTKKRVRFSIHSRSKSSRSKRSRSKRSRSRR
jgi:hypothetical protein